MTNSMHYIVFIKERKRKKEIHVFSWLSKCLICSLLLIIICLVLYIPVYEIAKKELINDRLDWSIHMNSDMKIYVLPNNKTTIITPKGICDEHNELFLLIIIPSRSEHFERRSAIRQTWGDYGNYIDMIKSLAAAKNLHKDTEMNDDYIDTILDLDLNHFNVTKNRNISINSKENELLIDEMVTKNVSDDDFILKQLIKRSNEKPNFKIVFLVGVSKGYTNLLQKESKKYEDILLEDFVDSYGNMSIKSTLMLKWISNNCKDNNVRYILKAQDDVFINVPRLMLELFRRSLKFDEKNEPNSKEIMLLGTIMRKQRVIRNPRSKWGSVYNSSTFPEFVSGTAYVITISAARLLYIAALKTNFFRLEEIFITGLCAMNAEPRITPIHNHLFMKPVEGEPCDVCCVYRHISVQGPFTDITMRDMFNQLYYGDTSNHCEKTAQIQNILDRAQVYVICKKIVKNVKDCDDIKEEFIH